MNSEPNLDLKECKKWLQGSEAKKVLRYCPVFQKEAEPPQSQEGSLGFSQISFLQIMRAQISQAQARLHMAVKGPFAEVCFFVPLVIIVIN
jgi:hypothetical protein